MHWHSGWCCMRSIVSLLTYRTQAFYIKCKAMESRYGGDNDVTGVMKELPVYHFSQFVGTLAMRMLSFPTCSWCSYWCLHWIIDSLYWPYWTPHPWTWPVQPVASAVSTGADQDNFLQPQKRDDSNQLHTLDNWLLSNRTNCLITIFFIQANPIRLSMSFTRRWLFSEAWRESNAFSLHFVFIFSGGRVKAMRLYSNREAFVSTETSFSLLLGYLLNKCTFLTFL